MPLESLIIAQLSELDLYDLVIWLQPVGKVGSSKLFRKKHRPGVFGKIDRGGEMLLLTCQLAERDKTEVFNLARLVLGPGSSGPKFGLGLACAAAGTPDLGPEPPGEQLEAHISPLFEG